MKHLIDLDHISVEELSDIIRLATDIQKCPDIYKGACAGKIMSTLFYEASTRTQMSFQSAMLRLGGGIIGFGDPSVSSVSKGESLRDTARIISGYSDVVVIRAPWEGAAKAVALYSGCPVINAGDGGHLHPPQTLTDVMTLMRERGRLDNLVIGICGDLKYGRTTHSLVRQMCKYSGNRYVFISGESLKMPDYIKYIIKAAGQTYTEYDSLERALPELDVLYMTRVQRERLQPGENPGETFVLDKKKMALAGKHMTLLHPLPRLDEIAVEVDDDPRALYFKQAEYGMYARMALILTLICYDKNAVAEPLLRGEKSGRTCGNPRCVTGADATLPRSYIRTGDRYECEFCEHIGN